MDIMDSKILIEDFKKLDSWQEKYSKIIAIGKKLPKLPEEFKIENLKVKGCQSQVWLKADLNEEGKVVYRGESDSLIVQGLLAMLICVYSGRSPSEILRIDPNFLEELGFKKHLSPNRANGVYFMVKQILLYAQAFKALEK